MRHCITLVSWLPKIFTTVIDERLGEDNTVEIVGELIPENSLLKKILLNSHIGYTLSLKIILNSSGLVISTRQYGISRLIDMLTDSGSLTRSQVKEKVVKMLSIQINTILPSKKQYSSDFNLLLQCVKHINGIMELLDENLLRDDDEKHTDHSIREVILPWIMNSVIKNICFGIETEGDISNVSDELLIVFQSCVLKNIKNYILKYKPEKSIWVGVSLIATRLAMIDLGIDEDCKLIELEINFSTLSYFWNHPDAKKIFMEIELRMLNDVDFQTCGKTVSQSRHMEEIHTKLKRTHSI